MKCGVESAEWRVSSVQCGVWSGKKVQNVNCSVVWSAECEV